MLATEGEQLAGQDGAAVGGLSDFLDILTPRISVGELGPQEVAHSDHDGQQIVEIMSDAACKASDGFQLLRLTQLLFQCSRGRDVAHNRGERRLSVQDEFRD